MDAPLRLGFRHALHPMHARFVFQPRKDALTLHMRRHVADAAQIAFLQLEYLEPPALLFGMALVHPQQVGGEKGGFLAARAGADFQDGRPGVGGIAGQQGQAQRLFHFGDARLQLRNLVFGQGPHVGVSQQRLAFGKVIQRAAVGNDLGHNRLEVAVFAAEGCNLGRGGACRKFCFEKLEALRDLGEFIKRNHVARFGPCVGAGQGAAAEDRKGGCLPPSPVPGSPPEDISEQKMTYGVSLARQSSTRARFTPRSLSPKRERAKISTCDPVAVGRMRIEV